MSAFHHDAWGRLVYTDGHGRAVVGAEPVRAFPITDPAGGVAVRDAEGREVAWVDDPAALPPESRAALEAELARRQFLPVVRRVLRVKAGVDPAEWELETDRGRVTILVNEEDVKRLPGDRALVIDGHKVRYLIPSVGGLDAASRRLVERYL